MAAQDEQDGDGVAEVVLAAGQLGGREGAREREGVRTSPFTREIGSGFAQASCGSSSSDVGSGVGDACSGELGGGGGGWRRRMVAAVAHFVADHAAVGWRSGGRDMNGQMGDERAP